nr:uncharacterized protein LOC105713271 [Aotus nancymaae]
MADGRTARPGHRARAAASGWGVAARPGRRLCPVHLRRSDGGGEAHTLRQLKPGCSRSRRELALKCQPYAPGSVHPDARGARSQAPQLAARAAIAAAPLPAVAAQDRVTLRFSPFVAAPIGLLFKIWLSKWGFDMYSKLIWNSWTRDPPTSAPQNAGITAGATLPTMRTLLTCQSEAQLCFYTFKCSWVLFLSSALFLSSEKVKALQGCWKATLGNAHPGNSSPKSHQNWIYKDTCSCCCCSCYTQMLQLSTVSMLDTGCFW